MLVVALVLSHLIIEILTTIGRFFHTVAVAVAVAVAGGYFLSPLFQALVQAGFYLVVETGFSARSVLEYNSRL